MTSAKNPTQWFTPSRQGTVAVLGSNFLVDNSGHFFVDNSGNFIVTNPNVFTARPATAWTPAAAK